MFQTSTPPSATTLAAHPRGNVRTIPVAAAVAVTVGASVIMLTACGTSTSAGPATASHTDTPTQATSAPHETDTPAVTPPAPSSLTSTVPCTATIGLPLPPHWPADLPLPPGLVVTYTQTGTGGRLITIARVPGDFHQAVNFWNARLPPAGYRPTDGQVDPHDAESTFTGQAYQGHWAAAPSPDCPGTTKVTVLVQPTSAATQPPGQSVPSS